jgi:hypothetical protein
MNWTLDGKNLIAGILHTPSVGPWVARLQSTHSEVPQGQVSLSLPGLTLQGTVVFAGIDVGRCHSVIVGGLDRFDRVVRGQHFQSGATARIIVQTLLSQTTMPLDPTSTALDRTMPTWAYLRSTIGHALTEICKYLGAQWWVTDEGLIKIGTIDWPDSDPPGLLVREVQEERKMIVAYPLDAPLRPRTTFQGKRIIAVDQGFTAGQWIAKGHYQ